MPVAKLHHFWRIIRPLLAPVFLCASLFLLLSEPIGWWLYGDEKFDRAALKEWIREASIDGTLPDHVRAYLELCRETKSLLQKSAQNQTSEKSDPDLAERIRVAHLKKELKREEISQFLKSLCVPPTKMYSDQLPLFPRIYRLSVHFDESLGLEPIVWDSELPRHPSQYRELKRVPISNGAWVKLQYRLHAFTQRQYQERQDATRRLWLSAIGVVVLLIALIWVYVAQTRERRRHQQHVLAEQQVSEAERRHLQEALKREEAERRREEAERQTLELKSQLFANIGIMAGSYAHNIKNLLVRPNDLISRCLEKSSRPGEQATMLHEVRDTLGTVTERLQQILQTVRRDPSKSERVRIDVNQLMQDMQRIWNDLAREKWKLELTCELSPKDENGKPAPLWIEGDLSHLQQAMENLLFNARDATFEMRNHLRDQARRDGNQDETQRRQAIIAAAGWKGQIVLRTRKTETNAILEVRDNGIGMDEEVRQRCLETHFSTKRDNALFAGLSAGMGLGLSFVTVILEHHQAKMEIESEPYNGSVFRVVFPLPAGIIASEPRIQRGPRP